MAKLSTIVGLLGKLESVDISVHGERCAVVRNRNSNCTKCADACTSGALSTAENELVINPDLCIGCGTCATVCPTCALEALHPNDAELAGRAIKAVKASQGRPVFACSRVLKDTEVDRGKVVEVTCLGRLEEALLSGVVVTGASTIYMVEGSCAECPNKPGIDTARLVKDTTNALLQAWGQEPIVEIVDEVPEFALEVDEESEAVDGISRRDFFTQIKAGAKNVAAEAALEVIDAEPEHQEENPHVVKVMKDGTLPHFIPNRRERLLDNLDRLGDPVVETVDTRLWGHVSIDESLCKSCRMCAVFCPTGAIAKFDDPDGTFGIEHRPADCVHCNLCRDICHWNALSLTSDVSTQILLDGSTERIPMAPMEAVPGKADSIYRSMYNLLGGGQVYER